LGPDRTTSEIQKRSTDGNFVSSRFVRVVGPLTMGKVIAGIIPQRNSEALLTA